MDVQPVTDVSPNTAAGSAHESAAPGPTGPLYWARGRSSPTGELMMVAVIALTLASTCWLLSAAKGVEEGHQAWRAGSVLRSLTTLMAMEFQYPTRRGVEVKWLTQGLGAAAAFFVGACAWYVRSRQAETDGPLEHRRSRGSPEVIGQTALVLYSLWMMISLTWAPWPDAALGEGAAQLMLALYAIAIGRSLSGEGVKRAALAMGVILGLTATLGIWYYIERNPLQRLKFPIGNPIFLAACLLPGLTICLAALGWVLASARPSSALSPQPARRKTSRPPRATTAVLAGLGMIALLTALILTDSRGPQLGLAVGIVAAIGLKVRGRSRQVFLAVILLALTVGAVNVVLSGAPDFLTRRMDTVLLRLYAWSYAWQILLANPLLGGGQGAYLLEAQHMSLRDAELLPQVFPAELMGHAHNEWLQILAELGIVGFALILIVLISAIWSGTRAMHRAPTQHQRWLALGLVAGLVAMVVSETVDVALRMPGLPVIFYTVIGLLWAMGINTPDRTADAQSAGSSETSARLNLRGRARPVGRVIGLILAVLLGSAIVRVTLRNWRGALEEIQASRMADNHRWSEALALAAAAQGNQIRTEDRLSALYRANGIASQAARVRFDQFRTMLSRRDEQEYAPRRIAQLAREDIQGFDFYLEHAIRTGQILLSRVPGYPHIAGNVAETFLLREQLEQILVELGFVEKGTSFLPQARQWLELEYACDRLRPEVALQLYHISPEAPLAYRLDLLRLPLRVGPRTLRQDRRATSPLDGEVQIDLFALFEDALAELQAAQGFDAVLNSKLESALSANPDDVSTWPDPFVPETLRLAARVQRIRRNFTEAAELAGQGVTYARAIADAFGQAPGNALLDQAGYLLIADPPEPSRAIEACQQALAAVDPGHADRRAAIQRFLVFCLLAADREDEARQTVKQMDPGVPADRLDRFIGFAGGELCRVYASVLNFDERPAWFDARLARSVKLIPDWPDLRLLYAVVLFEQNQPDRAMAEVEAMIELTSDRQTLQTLLNTLIRRFPDHEPLRSLARQRPGVGTAQTQPAATRPNTTAPTRPGA